MITRRNFLLAAPATLAVSSFEFTTPSLIRTHYRVRFPRVTGRVTADFRPIIDWCEIEGTADQIRRLSGCPAWEPKT